MVRGNCPHAIESTANLLEVINHDSAASTSTSHRNQLQTRLAYAMAIIRSVNVAQLSTRWRSNEADNDGPRPSQLHSPPPPPPPSPIKSGPSFRHRFVNCLVDPLQTTFYARSMATLAAQLGLPLWFVELRHAATHEDLPTLPVLQDAARQVSISSSLATIASTYL